MTSYSIERPSRSPVRPGLAHLSLNQVTMGQPVTIRTYDDHGHEVELESVYVRADGLHMRCSSDDQGNDETHRYRPSQVFPRRVTFRRWVVTLTRVSDGELVPFEVSARTHLEARVLTVQRIRAAHGPKASYGYRLHSVKREG